MTSCSSLRLKPFGTAKKSAGGGGCPVPCCSSWNALKLTSTCTVSSSGTWHKQHKKNKEEHQGLLETFLRHVTSTRKTVTLLSDSNLGSKMHGQTKQPGPQPPRPCLRQHMQVCGVIHNHPAHPNPTPLPAA